MRERAPGCGRLGELDGVGVVDDPARSRVPVRGRRLFPGVSAARGRSHVRAGVGRGRGRQLHVDVRRRRVRRLAENVIQKRICQIITYISHVTPPLMFVLLLWNKALFVLTHLQ